MGVLEKNFEEMILYMKTKAKSNSKSAYSTALKYTIKNKSFCKKKSKEAEENIGAEKGKKTYKHTFKFLSKDLRNTDDDYIHISRRVETMNHERKMREFHNLIKSYEEEYHKNLCDVSHKELYFQVRNYAEKESSYLYIKDSTEQFVFEKFALPDIVKIYLYKIFYPRIFEYTYDEEQIQFSSNYINENFDDIFLMMETLFKTIIYDAFIVCATEHCICKIKSLKKFDLMTDDFIIDECPDFNTLKEIIRNLIASNSETDKRYDFLEIMIPTIMFITTFHIKMYSEGTTNRRETGNSKVITLFKKKWFIVVIEVTIVAMHWLKLTE